MTKLSDEFLEGVIRDVAELSDRTSPPDAPQMMLVSADELRTILETRLMAIGLREAAPEQLHTA